MPPAWLAAILDYFLIGVRYHHIHHLNVRIPAYRLADSQHAAEAEQVYRANRHMKSEFADTPKKVLESAKYYKV